MPGALVSVAVEVGDEVEPGQELAVVEAMKCKTYEPSRAGEKMSQVAIESEGSVTGI